VPARIPGVLASAPACIALAIWYGRFGTRARARDPDPRNGCVDGCLVVLTMNREWIATDAGDLPVVKVQASGDISPSKVMQPCAASSSECFGRCLRPRGDGEGPPGLVKSTVQAECEAGRQSRRIEQSPRDSNRFAQ
jgi:hypothetical protein